ncbi:olfactory receptor 8U3-like [Rhinophrynus dorsalis]
MPDLKKNKTNELFLQGFSEDPQLQIPLFCAFLLIYLLTLLGNLVILTVIYMNPVLHIPMYLFLCSLSCIDISASSVSQPKLLSMLLLGDNSISFFGCLIQLYCFMSLIAVEIISLTSMAYDRFVAICNPLRYSILMNKSICVKMIIICWIWGFFVPISHTLLISQLSFCRSHVINHFFCDFSMLIKLSCTDTFYVELNLYLWFICSTSCIHSHYNILCRHNLQYPKDQFC